jgi:hypothetical protein
MTSHRADAEQISSLLNLLDFSEEFCCFKVTFTHNTLVGEKLSLFWPSNDRHSLITLTLRWGVGWGEERCEGGGKLTKLREKRMKEQTKKQEISRETPLPF